MILRTAVVLIALLVSSAAQASYITYQQWQAMSEAVRNGYIMGAFDGYVYDNSTLITPQWEQAAARHYNMCISKAKMRSDQLAANVLNFAKDKPELHTGSVQHVLLNYLFAACGAPPTK